MSHDTSHRTAVVVGAVAAAAGLVVASYLIMLRMRAARATDGKPLRTVREVLTDAYARMQDLQDSLSELGPSAIVP